MSFVYNGLHLMVDALVKDGDTLTKPAIGVKMIEDIIEKIDMTMILPPVTVNFPHAICEMTRVVQNLEAEGLGNSKAATELRKHLAERKNESYGYSTFAMIAESHLSIHTFPELNYLSFDCYSCKTFNVNAVIDCIEAHFECNKLDIQSVDRKVPDVNKVQP